MNINKLFYTAFVLGVLLVASLCLNVGQFAWHQSKAKEWQWQMAQRDSMTVTDVRTDTVYKELPPEKEVRYVGTAKVKVAKNTTARDTTARDTTARDTTARDTAAVTSADSLYMTSDSCVNIPITQVKYTDDSTYTAWVSGYRAKLDSIEVYQKTQYVTTTITQPAPTKKKTFWSRFKIGVIGGYTYGLQSKEWEPSVGVGGMFSF